MENTDLVKHKTPLLSNAAYDRFKALVMLVLPALGTLYFSLAQIWNFPNAEQVVGTLAAITMFLSIFLKVSDRSYNVVGAKYDGSLIVDSSNPDKDVYRFGVGLSLEELKHKKEITLNVIDPDEFDGYDDSDIRG